MQLDDLLADMRLECVGGVVELGQGVFGHDDLRSIRRRRRLVQTRGTRQQRASAV